MGTLFSIIMVTKRKNLWRSFVESQVVEFVWTLAPAFVLFAIGLPSLRLLYLIDERGIPSIMIKALGHQWYWEYDIPGADNYDSYLTKRRYRLLNTDNRLSLPISQIVQVLITSADVLHSWTLPVLGVKRDAVPGRVNKQIIRVTRPGVYYGQCSEICGSNHRFIPITIECNI